MAGISFLPTLSSRAISPSERSLPLEIGLQEQQDIDFDWFCVDEAGEIGHFTTAGFKRLPESVSRSAEDLELVAKYFKDELCGGRGFQVDPLLADAIPDAKNRGERYLRSFVAMAERGLFSFDIDSYLKPGISYFRVACPVTALKFDDLPPPIQQIVGRTVLKRHLLRSSSSVPYEETLSM
jgi:hypothetical protein